LALAFMWEYSYKRLKLAQLRGQLGVFLTRGLFPDLAHRPVVVLARDAAEVLRLGVDALKSF
jgi:hypothetical protein